MFRTSPTWLKALLVGQVVNTAGAVAWLYLTLYLVDARGFTPGAAGLVTATFGVGAVVGNLTGGSLGDRYGFRSALVASLAAWTAACALFPVAPTPLLAPLSLAAGLTGGMSRPLISALVATGLPPERRREGIALSRAAANLGTVLGPPLGGLLAGTNFTFVFVLDAVTSLVLLGAILRWCPSPRIVRDADAPRSLLHVLRTDRAIRVLIVSALAADTSYRLLYTVLPLFLADHGAPPLTYGLTVSVNCAVIVLFEPRIARRLAVRPAVPVIAAGYAIVGLGWLVLGAAPYVAVVFIAVLVITAGEMLFKPTATARAADLAPAGMVGRYQSLYAGASIGGMLLAPLLGTPFYGVAPRLVWPVAGVVAMLAAAWLAHSGARGSARRAPRGTAAASRAR
ncbi:MAG: MFS transporter [Mycobacteriales bacterium]